MGRRAHLLRLALGRSADLPPDWKSLEDRFHTVSESQELVENLDNHNNHSGVYYRSTDAKPGDIVSGLTFNSKGRPVDLGIEWRDLKVCEAQNDLLSLAGEALFAGNEQDASSPKTIRPTSHSNVPLDEATIELSTPYTLYEGTLSEILCPPLLGWISSLRRRIFLLRSLNTTSITELFINEWHTTTPVKFFFSGVPTFFFTNVVVIDSLIEYIISLPAKHFKNRKTIRILERNLSFILHSRARIKVKADKSHSILVSFLPLSVVAQLQQLRLNPSAALVPSKSLFKPNYGLFHILRGIFTSVIPAFVIQFIDSQIYEEINDTLSTYLQAYVLKPQNVADDYVVFEGLESLERHFDGLDLRQSCFTSRLGAALPRRMYGVVSRTCDALTQFLGWNGYRLTLTQYSAHSFYEHDSDSDRREESRPKLNSDMLSNRPATIAATQLAHVLTYAITIPIEGIILRSFTWLVVDMPWSPFHIPGCSNVQNDIYHIVPRWTDFKRDGVSGTLGYIAKVSFCLGVEGCIRFALVTCLSEYTIWVGKRYRNWGTGMPLLNTRTLT